MRRCIAISSGKRDFPGRRFENGKMMDRTEIISYFKEDPVHFANVEYALREGGEIVYAEEDGIALRVKKYGIPTVYGLREESAEKILRLFGKPEILVCSSEKEAETALKIFPYMTVAKPCLQVRYDGLGECAPPEGFSVGKLADDPGTVSFVTRTYSLHYGEEEIRTILRELGMYGAFYEGRIAAYIGRHEEGSVGLLEVMPEFRRRGLGNFLVRYAAARVADEGKIAYAQIVEGNAGSLSLHEKMGIYPSQKKVFWCY